MTRSFNERLAEAESLADIFELVKHAVRKAHKTGRAGLTLGLAELGGSEAGFVGAFYPFGSNIIVMNKTPLRRIMTSRPQLYKPYSFLILLHEYLHSLGYVDEGFVRETAYKISLKLFGEEHLVTQIAEDLGRFLPELIDPGPGWQPTGIPAIEMVRDFDRSSTEYIM
jgi:hypothetical protein